MRKKELAKKWRKVFSAILAATVITTSAVPESLVLAADVGETQGFGDSESMGFQSGQDEVSDDSAEEQLSVPEPQDENSDDTENETDGFTDDVESFSSENETTVEAGSPSLASVAELQERINSLPTVDEFKVMADGTTVEDSTLNQKQIDVYNEAQAIADALDQLSEEEQGQIDTSKLEALFEYFNSMTEEMATTISPVTSGSKYISSGGTYTLNGGDYTTNGSAIIIDTTSPVTLNVAGNIKATSSSKAFIYVQKACSNLTINGNGYTINVTGYNVLSNDAAGNVTITGGIFTGNSNAPAFNNLFGGTLTFRAVTVNNGAINNYYDGSKVNIEEGTKFNAASSLPYGIYGGNIRITGGTVNGNGNSRTIFSNKSFDDIEITGGSVIGGTYGIYINSASSGNVKIGGSAELSNTTADVYLYTGKTFVVNENYQGKVKVALSSYPSSNVKQQITKSQSTDYQKNLNVVSANSNYTVDYNTSGKYLYLWNHSHTWSYTASRNTVTAKCTSNSQCDYASGLTLTLSATDMRYSGSAYNKASITNDITAATGVSASAITYVGRGGTSYTESTTAPTNAGKYTAKVTIGGATATADFSISKLTINPSVTLDGWVYGENANTPSVSGNTGNGTVTYAYKTKGADDTTYTDAPISDIQKLPVGEYTLKATIEATTNYEGRSATCDFSITKTPIQVSPTIKGWEYGNYGDTINKPKLEEGSNPGGGEVTYTYYIDEACQTKTTQENSDATGEGKVPADVGTYYVKATVASIGNYAAGEGKTSFEITPKNVTVTVKAKNKTYDGNRNAEINDIKEETGVEDQSLIISGLTGTFSDANVGSKKKVTIDSINANVTPGENTNVSNYTVSYTSSTAEADINPKAVTVTPDNASKTYGEKDGEFTYTVKGLVEEEKLSDITLTRADGETVGTYEITASQKAGANPNYSVTFNKGIFTINKANVIFQKPEVKSDLTYNGKAQDLVTAKEVTGGTLMYKVNDGEWSDQLPTAVNAGTYTISYKVVGDANHEGTKEETVTVGIAPKVATVTPDNVSKIYGEKDEKLSYHAEGLVDGETLSDITLTRAEGETVGTYEITASQKDGANPNYSVTFNKGIFTINKANVIFQKPEVKSDLTYNGKAQDLVTAKEVTGGTLMYKVNDGEWSSQLPTGVNAGTYTISYKVVGDANHENIKAENVTVNIAPKAVTVTPDNASKTYGEKDGELTYTVKGLVEEEKLSDITLTRADGETVGTYEITAAQKDGANPNYSVNFNQGTFTINKANVIFQKPEIKTDLTYNGKAQDLVIAKEVTGGTLMYKVNDGEWSDQLPTGVNAGTYTISYKVVGDANHENIKAENVTVNIAPKAVTVTPDNASKTYGEKDGELTYTVKGLVEEEKLSDITLTRADGETVGTYEITAAQKDGANPNYSVTFNQGTFTINKANVIFQKPEVKSDLTYNGKAQELVTTKEVTGGILMYKINDGEWSDQLPTAVNAGTYTISYKVVGDANHESIKEETLTVCIVPKAATVTPDNASKIYGEKDGELTYTVKGLVDKETLSDITLTRAEGENAGIYEITASQKDDANPNYSVTFNKGTFTINKANVIFQKPEVKSDLIYNGEAQNLVTAKEVTGGTLMYKVNDGEWSDQLPTGVNAGNYTISYKVVGDVNHEDSKEETLTIVIVPKEITVTADDVKKVAGEADPELTYTAEGLAEKDTLVGITVERKAGEKVGTYAINISQAEGSNPNYKITFKKGTFTIQQADQSKLNGKGVSKLKLPLLLAKGKGGNKSIKLSWLKYADATGYEAYWCYCDGSANYKKFATVKSGKLSATHKKLKSNREYKYFVVAYKMEEGRKIYLAKSNTLHVAMKEANTTNAAFIKVNKSKVSLAIGKTFKLKCTTRLENSKKKQLSHVSDYRYYTNNSKVATVSKAGVITAKGKGTCTVYVLANNGVYKKIKVTVK